jgi:hypothetical protein
MKCRSRTRRWQGAAPHPSHERLSPPSFGSPGQKGSAPIRMRHCQRHRNHFELRTKPDRAKQSGSGGPTTAGPGCRAAKGLAGAVRGCARRSGRRAGRCGDLRQRSPLQMFLESACHPRVKRATVGEPSFDGGQDARRQHRRANQVLPICGHNSHTQDIIGSSLRPRHVRHRRTISGQPGLPPEARELTVHFTFSQRAKTVAEHELAIQIDAASAE